MAQIPICQRAHGAQSSVMGADIGVAGGPPVTQVKKFSAGLFGWAIDHTGGPKARLGVAVGTLYLFLFQTDHLHYAPMTALLRLYG